MLLCRYLCSINQKGVLVDGVSVCLFAIFITCFVSRQMSYYQILVGSKNKKLKWKNSSLHTAVLLLIQAFTKHNHQSEFTWTWLYIWIWVCFDKQRGVEFWQSAAICQALQSTGDIGVNCNHSCFDIHNLQLQWGFQWCPSRVTCLITHAFMAR